MSATPTTIDFTNVRDRFDHASGISHEHAVPMSAEGLTLTPKQIRARARRRRKRGQHLTTQEMDYLYRKPMSEWDLEELAHGRPRNSKGTFSGPAPQWIDRTVHEEAMTKYTAAVKTSMRATTVDALGVITQILKNEDVDERGRPLVSASTKLDASKFLIEHIIGKPTQRIENDVSVKLQAILGQVMVNPSEMATGNYMSGHFPGVTMALATGDEREEFERGE